MGMTWEGFLEEGNVSAEICKGPKILPAERGLKGEGAQTAEEVGANSEVNTGVRIEEAAEIQRSEHNPQANKQSVFLPRVSAGWELGVKTQGESATVCYRLWDVVNFEA